ncbi:MAG TPA: glycosyltransferase family 9 protein [Desulfuromonadaceae bacterium]
MKPWENVENLKVDCRWFRGHVPCRPHKQFGVHCVDEQGRPCEHYDRTTFTILIIKLGAIGDVIRTTPLLRKLKALYPHAQVWWLTLTPEVVPSTVDVVLGYTPQSLATLAAMRFDLLINLDKDREACALANTVAAARKMGFVLRHGVAAPADQAAVHKFLTGLWDDLNRENTRSYPQEIFEICGFEFAGERYMLDSFAGRGYAWDLPRTKPIVGLNTGCGGRWTSRLWAEENWVDLACRLAQRGYTPLLLGGEQEHARNGRIAASSGALYLGYFPLPQFINLVDQCELVVTAVTMAMHITIGLNKKIVLFNNIFNRHEFELYGLGEILEPGVPCTCYYSPECPNNCMQHITVERVLASCVRLLGR